MNDITIVCPYCGEVTEIEQHKENTKVRCGKCKKEFMAYEAVNCHSCGKLKHPNRKCRNCDASSARAANMANVVTTLINPLSALSRFAGSGQQNTEAEQEVESEIMEQETSLPEKRSGVNLHPAEHVSIGDVAALVESNLQTLWAGDEETAKAIPPVMIWGAPGVGKSTAIRELAKKLGIGFIDVRLAQREPVDMRGLPVPDGEQVRWLVSSEWPRDPESKGIIIFDELTAADKTLQVAAYEFILDRRLGDLYKVPKNWYIVAAGNRTEDRAVACSMSSALANRFLHVEVAPQLRDFITYGESHGMHPVVLDFLRFRPKLLFSQKQENLQRGWPSPRSWERVSTILKIADQTGNKCSLQYILPGLVGMGAATEFLGYYNDLFMQESHRDIKERLINGDALPLPEAADQAYAICEAVILFITQEKEPKVQFAMFDNFLANSFDWSSDYAAMVLNGVIKGTSRTTRRKKILLSAQALPQWIAKHHLENASCLASKK